MKSRTIDDCRREMYYIMDDNRKKDSGVRCGRNFFKGKKGTKFLQFRIIVLRSKRKRISFKIRRKLLKGSLGKSF